MAALGQPTALVTGATSGIGRAIALALRDQGYRVTATGRNARALESLAAEPDIDPIGLDLTDRAAMTAAFKNAHFDVLVNNAGMIPKPQPFDQMQLGEIDATLAVNLGAVLSLTRLVLPAMIAAKSGHVFFTSSIAAHTPYPNLAVYGATKAAISSFAGALRGDVSGTGLRITEIVAGRVETALYNDVLSAEARAALYADYDAVQPADVAQILVAVLAMPAHVDVTRFDSLPTAQFIGGGGAATKEC